MRHEEMSGLTDAMRAHVPLPPEHEPGVPPGTPEPPDEDPYVPPGVPPQQPGREVDLPPREEPGTVREPGTPPPEKARGRRGGLASSDQYQSVGA